MEQPPQSVEEFVTWVLDQDPSLKGMDSRVRSELEADYVEELDTKVTRALVDAVPEELLADVEQLLDHGSMPEIQAWITHRVPNVNMIILQILTQFKEEYLSA
jgi:hypothetical protein